MSNGSTTSDGFVLNGYQVRSSVEIELDQDNGVVHGDDIQVKNAEGQVLYENLRGFLPLTDKFNLVRFANGIWALVYLNKSKQVNLKKVNLYHAGICLLFDERGKLHANQESPHYRKIIA